MPREIKGNMEEKMKTHNFITRDMKTNIHAMLDRLCCKKKRNSEIENTDVAIVVKADTSYLANEEAVHDL